MKLLTEKASPIHSNAVLWWALGPNAVKRFKIWKCCVLFWSSRSETLGPFAKEPSNFKIDERQMVWRYVWRLARDIVGDEQAMEFKGNYTDKLRIT